MGLGHHSNFAKLVIILSLAATASILLLQCLPPPLPEASPTMLHPPSLAFDGEQAYAHALAQCAFGPRPTGSEAIKQAGDYIIAQLESAGWLVETQGFEFQGLPVRNIIAKTGEQPARSEAKGLIILGAHYDTRPLADRDPEQPEEPIIGGNDGASGVAVLLELARVLEQAELEKEVWLAFFDAEDRGGIEGWPFSVGARYMAANLEVKPETVIIVDMVGDADQEIYYEGNSDPALREEIWDLAADLGYGDVFVPQVGYTLTDDHLPFIQRFIPAVDIIDFNYPYWHTLQDTCDKVSAESLERVGRVLEAFIEESD